MKKLLIVAYDINPNLGSESGTAYLWASSIPADYEVTVCTRECHRKGMEGTPLKVIYIPGQGLLQKGFIRLKLYHLSYALFLRRIKPLLTGDGYDLIHFLTPAGIHSFNPYAAELTCPYIAGPIGGFLKLPAGFEAYRTLLSRMKESYYSSIIRNKKWQSYFCGAARIIAGTGHVVRHLPESCREQVLICHDSVIDTTFFHGGKVSREDNRVQILYSGRMELYKGCMLLYRAFAKLLEKGHDNLELVYAGWGSQRRALEKAVARDGLGDRIRILGRVPKEKVRDLLCASDIFCLPTLKEPGGTAILEAMACKLPVVTTRYGGPAESVTEDCGILIEPTSIDNYIDQLVKSLEVLVKDADLRALMGEKGRSHVISKYSVLSLKEKIPRIYENVIRKPSGRNP